MAKRARKKQNTLPAWMERGMAALPARWRVQSLAELVPLAVTTQKRSAALPDVPTTLELGLADSDYTFWNGILAPAQTPKPIVDRLNTEIGKILAQAEVKEKLAKQGVEPLPLSPAEFDALMQKEIAANLALAKAAGLKFN